MKKLVLLIVVLFTSFILIGCQEEEKQVQYIEVEKEVIKEVEVPVYIEKEVIKEVPIEIPVEVETIVEKEVIIEKPVEVIKEVQVEVPVEKIVEIQVEVEKIVEVPVEVYKQFTLSNPTTYAEVSKAGTHFDYLLVWNASNNIAGGCYDSYVLPYECEDLPGGTYNYMEYTNYSCFNYKAGENYSKYIVDCANRTSPGRYLDPFTGNEMDWEDSPYGTGVYILTNATIYSCHQSTMCTYGGVPVSQVLIVYDQAYTPLQFIEAIGK